MMDQIAVRRLLNEELSRAQEKNPAYSLRALARRLDIGPATLSQLLSGKRRVSRKLAERVASRLMLDPRQQKAMLGLFEQREGSAKKSSGGSEVLRLEADHFTLIADWYHFAILSLLETSGVPAGKEALTEWAAGRLGLAIRKTRTALDRLERLHLAVPDSSGRLRPTGDGLTTTDEVSDAAIRKNHFQVLDRARESLEQDALSERDFTSITMAIDPAKLPEAKKLIRDFRDSLCQYLESGKKKEVYNLSVQLVPLTKKGEA